MTATRLRRTDPTQPELPLHQQPVGPDPAPDPGHHGGVAEDERGRGPADGERGRSREWRLDEQTRQIGLRGVALARAQLRRSEATGNTGRQGRGRGPSGRAA